MDLSEAVTEMLNDFKKNTGVLLPITKFLLSNLFLLSLLVVVPLKIAFWIFQLGYLSTFGITYETIQRNAIQAQQLWVDMFTVLSPVLIWIMGLSLSLCIFALFYPPIINYFRLKRLIKRLKINNISPIMQSNISLKKRFWKVYFNRVEKQGKIFFGFAKTSYALTLIFIILLIFLTRGSLYMYEHATDIAEQKITEFKKNGTCDDGSGQLGCFSLKTKTIEYRGFLVATSNESVYFLSEEMELLIVAKPNILVLSRDNVQVND
ncbi:hypothetical protein [Pseudoalteromonas sp. SR43-3]|uniref:hypothetical protein n=1 Tax=Pseudoalteromonas sp. SR43-3 TaxID=2760943 RepID=UPI0015FFF7A5|nr:hypothetical protein [Pseudoalteromonas sp. SR43-3]MBB1276207.1 hypothetical protein [Pseudoalteromonas sp. SR43-3]